MTELIPLILGIVKDGLSLWSDERRTRFMKQHHKLLTEVSNAQDKTFPHYNDSDVDMGVERLRLFLEAYWVELKKETVKDEKSV
jgi:hypothetical protein